MTQRVMLTRPRRHYDAGLSVASTTPQEKQNPTAGTSPLSPSPYGGEGRGGIAAPADNELNNVMAQASALSKEQRAELLAQLSLEVNKQSGHQARDVEMWATAVHEALQEALGGALGSVVGPLAVRRIVGTHKAFEPVAEFMAKSRLSENQVRERLSIYRLLADLLVAHARKAARYHGAPLSLKLVANSTANVAGLFDAAFPGYLAAGLAPVVARRLTQK